MYILSITQLKYIVYIDYGSATEYQFNAPKWPTFTYSHKLKKNIYIYCMEFCQLDI